MVAFTINPNIYSAPSFPRARERYMQVYTSSTAALMKYGPDSRSVFLIITSSDLRSLDWYFLSLDSYGKSVRAGHSRDTEGNTRDRQGFGPHVLMSLLWPLTGQTGNTGSKSKPTRTESFLCV